VKRKGRKRRKRMWVKGKEDEGEQDEGWEERSRMETPRSRIKILQVLWRKERQASVLQVALTSPY
jgi:hypothetical protein